MPSPNTNIDEILNKLVDSCYNEHLNAIKEKRIPSFTTEEAKTQLEALLCAAKIEELQNIRERVVYGEDALDLIDETIKELEKKQ